MGDLNGESDGGGRFKFEKCIWGNFFGILGLKYDKWGGGQKVNMVILNKKILDFYLKKNKKFEFLRKIGKKIQILNVSRMQGHITVNPGDFRNFSEARERG